ncbi:MAG: acylneuraminate cytidylyltransferase family protein [Alphaproteobacteria bacterium]|nr:acylneuraminate cytidylyltransferase family protein [Alphaproteobacteria bacterium]
MLEAAHGNAMAIIPLRAGSKGLPGKNIRPLAGKPLYLHSVDQALRVVGHCAISTDISDVLCGDYSPACRLVARPPELAQDQTPIAPVLMHVFEHLKQQDALPKIAVLLQATSPLRRDEDIRDAIALYKSGRFELVMSVVKTDPGILKYGFAKSGRFTPVSSPEFCFSNRQSLPEIVRPNGAVYVFSPQMFMQNGSLATQSIGSIEMPETHSIDIDTIADLKAAEEFLLRPSFSKAS